MRTDRPITGTILRDLVKCPQRVRHDLFADPALADGTSDFVQLLWSQGSRYEDEVLAGLGFDLVDLREDHSADPVAATIEAMKSGARWIAGAHFVLGDRVGKPDLLLRGDRGYYYAGDVKSGTSRAPNGVHPRKEYAAQVGFYSHLLRDGGWGAGDRAFVIGRSGEIDWYGEDEQISRDGPTLGAWVGELTNQARAIRDGHDVTRPALGAACALCSWRTLCRGELDAADDLTLIPGLGAAVRANLEAVAPSVTGLAEVDVDSLTRKGGTTEVKGLGAARLDRFQHRARALRTPGASAYAVRDLGLRRMDDERHLDLETDPTNGDFVYLHGIQHRVRTAAGDEERYVHFLAESHAEERDAFAGAFEFLTENPEALVTTFSAFEKTTYRLLARRYPEVASIEAVEALFERDLTIDLYLDFVLPSTVWPLSSYGLKKLARHLGFDWRDADPSGASSISWFVDYMRTRDPALRQRILDYNEDDVRASMVVFDGLIGLPVRGILPWPPT